MGSGLMAGFLDNLSHERRILIAAMLCIAFSFVFSSLFAPPPPPPESQGPESDRPAELLSDETLEDREAETADVLERAGVPAAATAPPELTDVPDSAQRFEDPLHQTDPPPVQEVVVDTPRARYVFSTAGATLRSCRLKDYAENDPPVELLEAERDAAFNPEVKSFWQARIEEVERRNDRIGNKRFRKGDTIPEEAWVELVPAYSDQQGFPLQLRFGAGATDQALVYQCDRSGAVEVSPGEELEIRFVATTDSGVSIVKRIAFSPEDPAFTLQIETSAHEGLPAVRKTIGEHWVLEWPDGLGHFPFQYKGSQEANWLYSMRDDSKENSPTYRQWLLKQAPAGTLGETPQDYRHGLPGAYLDWINVETRYFIASFMPQKEPMSGVYIASDIRQRHEFDTRVGIGVISETSEAPKTIRVYTGPKLTDVLADLAYGLDRVVYDSWFGAICLFVEWLLGVFYALIPSYGVAIVLLCILSKVLLYPLTYKQAQMQMKMAELQPKIKELQERFKDDKQKLSQEQMKLWKKHGVNPASGCLPMLAQLPIFIALYRTIQSSIDLRGAPFLWIDDLSLPDMSFFLPFSLPFIGVALNVLPLIMTAISVMQMQQQKQSMPDPAQAQMMTFMPVIFLFVLYNFSSGLVLYWTFNSLTQWAQQKVMEHLGHAHTPQDRARLSAGAESKAGPDDEGGPDRPRKKIPPQKKSKPKRRRAGSRT
jgi:YidC/Oxa1 family membrane protein insertase